MFAQDYYKIIPWPAGVQPQSNADCLQKLATCIRDRILEPEGIQQQHITCTQEAKEDNTPGRTGNLETLVNDYSRVLNFYFVGERVAFEASTSRPAEKLGESRAQNHTVLPCILTMLIHRWNWLPKQVTQPTLELGGITWPDIYHPAFNLPSETKLQKMQNIQRDLALLSSFSQSLSTFPERNRVYDFGNLTLVDKYGVSPSSIPLADSFPAINVNPFNSQAFSPPNGCYTSVGQKALRLNLPELGLTDEDIDSKEITHMSDSYGVPVQNSEDLNNLKYTSELTGCATTITLPRVGYQLKQVCPSVFDGGPRGPYAETGTPFYLFSDAQICDIETSTGTTGSSKYVPRFLEESNSRAIGQGSKLDINNISFEELPERPLNNYQDNIMFSPASSQTSEWTPGTSNNGERMDSSGNGVMNLRKYSIGEPPELPHFDGNGAQSSPTTECAGDYHQSRSSVSQRGSPHMRERHTHDLTRRRRLAGQTQSRGSLRQYPCPISSCSRNRTNSKRVLRSDNLGDHLRKDYKLDPHEHTAPEEEDEEVYEF
ncbi:hypothetical protein BGX38DRAFT_1257450 [Terfezia claveryi]|nr:hypothetical protein BGX38DRAFT_1257450 [Terfezia claveryi]